MSFENAPRKRPVGRPHSDGTPPESHHCPLGVTRHSPSLAHPRPFKAQLVIQGKARHLGNFATIPEAVAIVAEARRLRDIYPPIAWQSIRDRLRHSGFSIPAARR